MKAATITRPTAQRVLSVMAMAALLLALSPAALADATSHGPDPRSTDDVCEDADAYDDPWDDLSEDNAHYRNVLCLVAAGIAAGYGDGTYGPADQVTRAQMATFIANMIELERPLQDGEHRFDDVSGENAHYDNIHALARAGVVAGLDEDAYGPDQPVRRDQMATFLSHAVDYAHQGAVDGSAPPAAEDGPYFEDVSGDDVHADTIDALAEQAVIAGYGDGTYGPADHVRRDQMASFILRSYDYLQEVLAEDPPAS